MTKDNYFDRKKTGYLNPLRVYACIAIILFHIFSIIVSSFGTSITENEKYISLLVRNICLWRVPAFVMISGVLFLNKEKEISIKKLWLKYISRIVLALLLFGIPFAFMEIYYDAHYKFNIGQIGSAVLNVFQGNLWDHMWYLYMLTGLYILLPLFKIFIYYRRSFLNKIRKNRINLILRFCLCYFYFSFLLFCHNRLNILLDSHCQHT